jgi:hypothetical protein
LALTAIRHWIGSQVDTQKGECAMVLKRLIGLVFAGALAFSAVAADIVVKIAPPRIVVEKRPPAPS